MQDDHVRMAETRTLIEIGRRLDALDNTGIGRE
jgi:hypothetical protein